MVLEQSDSAGLYLAYLGAFTLAALVSFASIPRLRRVRDRDTRIGLISLVAGSGVWSLSLVGFLAAPTTTLKLLSYVIGLVVGFGTVGAWLYFCSAYAARSYHKNPRIRRLAVVVFIAVITVKLTNHLHGQYFTTSVVNEPFPHLAVQTGALHWVTMAFSYALAFVGFFMLFEVFSAVDFDTTPLAVLVGFTALPVIVDIVGLLTPWLVDMTYEPLGVAVFAVGVAFVYRERFESVRYAAEHDQPIVSLDADGTIRDANRPAIRLFPELEHSTGRQFAEVLPAVSDRLASDEPVVSITTPSGTRYLQVTETPLGAGSEPVGSSVVFTDVTEREQYRRELERQNDRLDQFASIVSHDLRNPLTVAQGRLELAREELDTELEDLEEAADALDRMETLIDDVLSIARTGQPVEETDEIDLETIVADAWSMVEAPDASLSVTGSVAFEGDRERVQRLLENLLRNAVDHGGPDVSVTVGPVPGEDGFYIEDNGPGVPPSNRDDIFGTGFTTGEDGTGFGLAIVAEIAEAHGWEIEVTEGESGGARFEITGISMI